MRNYEHSDYIIYGDESGDHSMDDVNKFYPAFVLAFCVFSKNTFIEEIPRQIKGFKFKFWGHDQTVLHSSKLRKRLDDFNFLNDQKKRLFFIEELNIAIEKSSFEIISIAVDKRNFREMGFELINPYELSLKHCIMQIYLFLKGKDQHGKLTHIIIESRGKKEDTDLQLAFLEITQTQRLLQELYPLNLIFSDKKTNSIGLQLADLVAYPIGRFLLDPDQENRAFDIVKKKLHGFPEYQGLGLEIFPNMGTPIKRKTPDFSEV